MARGFTTQQRQAQATGFGAIPARASSFGGFGGGGFSPSIFSTPTGFTQVGGKFGSRVIGPTRETPRLENTLRIQREAELARLNGLLGIFNQQGFGMSTGPAGPVGNPFQEGIDKIAASRRAAIEEGSQDALNNSLARLQDRGLGGSSFSLNAERGAERDEQAALSDLSGDIGALEIRGQEAAMSLEDRRRQQQFQLFSQLLGQVF